MSAVFDDPERYKHDGFYEEDTDYEDEYETDDSDYIVDDEEDENALWDDEEEAADDLPEKKRRKRKNQVVLADNDTDTEETELSEQAMWQIAKEEQLIEELEADAEEHPFEDGTDEEEPERKKLKRELRAEALARLEDSARTQRDFENVIAWWNRLDANRERRERYHELSRSGDDVPLDYGASANELFFPDTLNDVLEKVLAADGLVLGSPVHYAAIAGQASSFFDRLFFASGGRFANKLGTGVVSCRRGGASAAFDELNKYFTISNMPVISGTYWNQVHGNTPNEVKQDLEGMQNMRALGRNMAWLLKCIEQGKAAGIALPKQEEKIMTNFVR